MTVWHVCVADLKMIVRNRQALFWALAFPLIFVVVFGLFRLDQVNPATIAVVDQSNDPVSRGLVEGLRSIELLEVDESRDLATARADLESGGIRYLLVIPQGLGQLVIGRPDPAPPAQLVLLYDQAEVQISQRMLAIVSRFVDRANLSLNNALPLLAVQAQAVQSRPFTYFDYLLPGFVGMGVMIYAVVGMATVLAFYRQQKILKRMLATPLPVSRFFAGIVLAHLMLAVVQAAIILGAGVLLFNAHVYGNLLWIAALVMLGNVVFLNLGFIVGSFARSPEAAQGIGNALTMPMMFFSGVFFSPDSLPAVMRAVVTYLPLTPLLEALRGVVLNAEPLWGFPAQLGILAIWIAATSVVAVRVFRFS